MGFGEERQLEFMPVRICDQQRPDFFGVAAGEVIQPLVERTTRRRISKADPVVMTTQQAGRRVSTAPCVTSLN